MSIESKLSTMTLAELVKMEALLESSHRLVSKHVARKSKEMAMSKRKQELIGKMNDWDAVNINGRFWFLKEGILKERMTSDEIQTLHQLNNDDQIIDTWSRP